jgi:hypothetical protein
VRCSQGGSCSRVVLRDGDDARSWKGGAGDRSSTRLVVVTYIDAEEQMLVEDLGDQYATYRTSTWRLVPFVW